MAINVSKSFIGAVKDDWRMFSDRPDDYIIGSPIGFGASSVVYAAVYRPPPPEPPHPYPCALKVLDLDVLPPHSLSLLQRETQLMSLSKHPNVLRVRGSWIHGHHLNIALRLMNKGSAADVMCYAWPGGMEEEVVKCILRQALDGLNYLHINGFIHRDVKAANLLIDDDGTVLVGDLGVAAPLMDDSEVPPIHAKSPPISNLRFDGLPPKKVSNSTPPSRPQTGRRKSFVGTPCWMAPELIQGKRYDAKADIWSFGITAIELTQGRPPRSREGAHAVLVQTVQGKAPTLECERGVHRYSRAFKEMVDACLAKDPSKRPSAAELLQAPFFKSAKKKSYLVGTILDGLPPLTMRQERVRRQDSLLSQRTVDSWDFSSPAGSCAPSLVGSNFKKNLKSVTFPLEPEHRDECPVVETCDSDAAKPPHSPPAHTSPDPGRDVLLFVSSSLLPVPASPSNSSESLSSPGPPSKATQHKVEPSVATSSPGSVVSRPPPTSPIPIPLRNSPPARRPSSAHSSVVVPSSSSPPSSQSFWNRLTRRPSRIALADEESPRGDKGNTITRFLGRRRSSTLTQRPILTPS